MNRKNTAATDRLIEAVQVLMFACDACGNQIGQNVTLWWEENG